MTHTLKNAKVSYLIPFLLLIAIACKESNLTKYSLSERNKAATIYYDENTDSLILWAINDLANDIEVITGSRPKIESRDSIQRGTGIYIGKCEDPLLETIKLNQINDLKGAWEAFHINSYQGNLIISGSDVRGTVYGIFELAERLGISPWKWWADVKPLPQESLSLLFEEEGITEKPSVQYRGIFLNDEDWGLQPWAANTFEPEVGDIGPKTYEKIFQLLLRLKANTIWPAMHPCTKAFYQIPGNNQMAMKYHIVVGTSHCEPMLRNNVSEWDSDTEGHFNYFTNKNAVCRYWQTRITDVANAENIITLGMRGIHDGHMEGGKNIEENKNMLEEIIETQRQMLSSTKNKSIGDIAQTVVLYKEVLDVYKLGLKVPDDVTLLWCDDNYGYIRRLSNEEEQKRSGGSGVYYHISYWGRPHDYLWLSTTQPGLIWYEMSKAYANGAQKIWIVNVGDIKPAEYGMEFFLDLAWDINSIQNDNIDQHLSAWAAREFGEDLVNDISDLMNEYYRLAFLRRPEFMGWSTVEPKTEVMVSEFNSKANGNELLRRIDSYTHLFNKVTQLEEIIPENRRDAWFQLVEYPIKGAALMNYKFLYAQLASETTDSLKQKEYFQLSTKAFQQIQELTTFYNEEMSSGKWKYMMSMNPRKLSVFDMPENFKAQQETSDLSIAGNENRQRIFIQANEYSKMKGSANFSWITIKGLGYSKHSVTLSPFNSRYFAKGQQPYIEYTFEAEQAGPFVLIIRFLPTHSNNLDHEIGIQIDENEIQYFPLNTQGRSEEWKQNVLRNGNRVNLKSQIDTKGKHTIRLYVNQTGIVIDQLAIDFAMNPAFYEIPIQ